MTAVVHPSVDERTARGRAAREHVPPSAHTGWAPAPDRPDPVALLEEQNASREPDLLPVRHGRMLVSPFTFYRGAAKIMATDLNHTPTAGLERTALRRRAPLELRCVRVTRTNVAVRAERLRRDASRSVRVRREAHGGKLHDRGPQQRLHPIRCARRDARVGRELPSTDGRARRDAYLGHLVRTLVGARPHERCQGRGERLGTGGQQEGWQDRDRRTSRSRRERRAHATACKRCRSWPSTSTAGTGSSANRRS